VRQAGGGGGGIPVQPEVVVGADGGLMYLTGVGERETHRIELRWEPPLD
jgi:hypothetical protein